MAIIPNDEKFIGLSASVDTTERRSALINAESQAYTMQDITDTVAAGLPAPTNPTEDYVPFNYNGTFADAPIVVKGPAFMPYGWDGFKTKAGALSTLPTGVTQENVAPYIPNYGIDISNTIMQGTVAIGDYNGELGSGLKLTVNNAPGSAYGSSVQINDDNAGAVFSIVNSGDVFQLGSPDLYNPVSMYNGLSFNALQGKMVIGCGISSPTNGVFKADGASGLINIGTTPSRSLGIFVAGSPAMQVGSALINGAPSNLTTPVAWTQVRNESGTIYYSPLYQ